MADLNDMTDWSRLQEMLAKKIPDRLPGSMRQVCWHTFVPE